MSNILSKLAVSVVLSGAALTVGAQTVSFPVPFSTGGHFSTLVPLTAGDLEKQGWKTDVKFVGKCGVALEQFKNAKEPLLTVWASNWLNKDNTCYMDVNTDNLVDVYMQAPNYLCGPKNTPVWAPTSGKTYTVGVTNSISKQELAAIDAYGKKFGSTFKPVVYTNSGGVRTAYHAGEVDAIFSSIGLEQQKTNGSRCLVTSATKPLDNMNTIWSETGLDPAPVWVGFIVVNPVGLTAEQAAKLKQDVRTVLSTNADISAYMQNKHLLGYPGTVEEQLKLIKQ